MYNIIESQLKKVQYADLTNFNSETNTYFIKKREDIKLEEDNCYLIHIKPTLKLNKSFITNWNRGSIPTYDYLKIDVSKIMVDKIKVVSVGYNINENKNEDYFWSGWLTINDIEVLKKV